MEGALFRIGYSNPGLVWREVLAVARHEQEGAAACAGPDDGVRKLDARLSADCHCLFGDFIIDHDALETVDKGAGGGFHLGAGTRHDFHPGDDTDGAAVVK